MKGGSRHGADSHVMDRALELPEAFGEREAALDLLRDDLLAALGTESSGRGDPWQLVE